MDGCDARHNEEVLLSTIDRFVMAITAAEVVAWPVLVSSSTAQSLPCGCVGAKCNPRCDKRRLSVKAPFCDGHHIIKVKPAIWLYLSKLGLTGSAMPASSSSLEAPAVRRGDFSVWRRFFARVLAAPTRKAEDEIAEYLERHKDDLPPMLRIELERRRMGL